MIIVDTCALFAYFKGDEADHDAAAEVIDAYQGRLVVSPFVVAELDHLVRTRLGVKAELAVIHELAEGEYEFPVIGAADLLDCFRLLATYADQRIGLADASLVILAQRYETRRILTFDRRDFSVLRSFDGRPLELLP